MAQAAFAFALAEILKHEGGFVNHPKDPGGATNLGVTKATYEGWTKKKVSIEEMKKLTVADVTPIYRKNYWDAVRGDELPKGLDLCVFDFGVNAGPSRSIKLLQKLVGTEADGKFGPGTLKAVNDYITKFSVSAAIKNFQNARRSYYRSLSTFGTFGRGWLRRVDEVERRALTL